MISKHHNTNFVQIPSRTEPRLVAEGKDAVDWHTKFIATGLHLTLLVDERGELSLCRFNFGPPNPAKFRHPIQQLPKEIESRIFGTSNYDLRTKQLSPCPTGECAATVERMVLTRSSRKRRQYLRNSFRKKLLFIFSRDDNRGVPSKKCSSAIAPKHECFESMYASHFSMTGKSLLA